MSMAKIVFQNYVWSSYKFDLCQVGVSFGVSET